MGRTIKNMERRIRQRWFFSTISKTCFSFFESNSKTCYSPKKLEDLSLKNQNHSRFFFFLRKKSFTVQTGKFLRYMSGSEGPRKNICLLSTRQNLPTRWSSACAIWLVDFSICFILRRGVFVTLIVHIFSSVRHQPSSQERGKIERSDQSNPITIYLLSGDCKNGNFVIISVITMCLSLFLSHAYLTVTKP